MFPLYKCLQNQELKETCRKEKYMLTLFTLKVLWNLIANISYWTLLASNITTVIKSFRRYIGHHCCCRHHRWHVAWHLTNLCFIYSEFTWLKDLIWNICSCEYHMHINSPWKWTFIHVSYMSVETVMCFSEYSVFDIAMQKFISFHWFFYHFIVRCLL
jgi:hypothetical protein